MSIEEFKSTDAKTLPIGELISIIAKNYTFYFNHHLEEFGINASQLHFLFEISNQKEVNQEKIASRCNINKGAVARSIKKLEDQGLIKRKIDENNRRQNKISLTPKGDETLKLAGRKLERWEEYVFDDLTVEKDTLKEILKEIIIKSIEFNQMED